MSRILNTWSPGSLSLDCGSCLNKSDIGKLFALGYYSYIANTQVVTIVGSRRRLRPARGLSCYRRLRGRGAAGLVAAAGEGQGQGVGADHRLLRRLGWRHDLALLLRP